MNTMVYDLIIIGAGPAGISACLYAARQKLKFLCVTKDIGGLANFIPEIDTYLGYHYMSGFELVKKFREHLRDYGVQACVGGVKSIQKTRAERSPTGRSRTRSARERKNFLVTADCGRYETKSILIATGRGFKKLSVKGEAEFENKGLSHCAACDGPLFKDKVVAVIGGGKSGLLSAMFLLKIAKKIYLLEKNPRLSESHVNPDVISAIKKSKKVEIITNANTTEILGNKFVTGLNYKQNEKTKTLNVGGVFVEIGYVPHNDFLKGFVKLNARGEIIINKENETSVRGIFAAGDCTDVQEKQVIVAAGEGAKACLSALTYIMEQ